MINPNALFTDSEKPFLVMGIVNVTPDSFSDGGQYVSSESAEAHAQLLVKQGADILDIGGASSRPGAIEIPPDEEIRRIVPVIEKIRAWFNGPISVDTTWAEVAQAAVNAGASLINDISAGRFDPKMREIVVALKCPVILMHSRGTPQTMQENPHYSDIVSEIISELLDSVKAFMAAGVPGSAIILDPGIGFAKTGDHNIELLKRMHEFVQCGFPVLLGTSRKGFIGKITGKDVNGRLSGSLATVASAFLKGVRIFRVHDVAETVDFLKVLSVIENSLALDYFCK